MKGKRVPLVMLTLLLFSASNLTANIQPVKAISLVGWWKLDEGSGAIAYDSSGNNNHGTIYGATWVDGVYGKALSFDGVDDYVEVPDSSTLDITGAIQISAWIKAVPTTDYMEIVDKGDQALYAEGYALRVSASSTDVPNSGPNEAGHANFLLFMGSEPWPYNTFHINSWTQVDDNNWHFIEGTYDGTIMKMYIDEALETTFAVSRTVNTNDYSLKIGRNIYEPYRFFQGLIDEIKIYASYASLLPVGGVVVPVDKFNLLAPYIGLASTLIVATAATVIYVKRRKEKQ